MRNISKLNNALLLNVPKRLQPLINSYKNSVFSGIIGKLSNYQVKLKINESIPPVAQKERRIPFALREKVKDELTKLEAEGIIETVTDEATPWISPMVIVPKNDGNLRICVDMPKGRENLITI
ncbi:uncharacterized protein LOC136078743 [Hydra vulgaris]|uniref:Uncharacterized protein LOC136078743 n=1 Tax=Hydra vulgaris TaxID=6087 RepID=A0ABM4BNE5_HYDVU